MLVFATFTSFVHRVTTQSIVPLYASSQLNLTPKEVGFLFSIFGFTVFAMILPAGFVIDKVGRKWATVPSTGIPALAFLLYSLSPEHLFSTSPCCLLSSALANGLSLGSLATSTYDVVPASARGRLRAARRTMAEMGGVGAPLLGGFLADSFGPGVPFLAYAPLLGVIGSSARRRGSRNSREVVATPGLTTFARFRRPEGLSVSRCWSVVAISVLFNTLLQPVGHDSRDLLIILLQHHHMAVAQYAHVFQFDEVDVYSRPV